MDRENLIVRDLVTQREKVIVDNAFIDGVIDVLFAGKDDNASIQFVLRLFGEYFQVQYVQIVEDLLDSGDYHTAYSWAAPACEDHENIGFVENLSYDDFLRYRQIFNKQGFFFTNDLKGTAGEEQERYRFYRSLKLYDNLQCAIMEKGVCKGFIALYDVLTKDRVWTQCEADTFIICAKILGFYLLNQRLRERNEKNMWLDPLTGAWNLTKFTMEANAFIRKPQTQKYAIVYSDIKKFKFINEAYGYAEGDRILVALKEVVTKVLAPEEMFARISSDHFLGLMRYEDKESFVKRLKFFADQINLIPKSKSQTYKLALISGICLVGPDVKSITTVIDRANIARQAVKSYHKSTCNFYNVEVKRRIAKEKCIEDMMEESLKNGEFIVYYQPKIDLASNIMVGAEALVRWRRSNDVIVPPDEFIPVFEKNGFIVEMDFNVFEQVCGKIRQWLDMNIQVVPISVNFSRVHLKTLSFVERLVEIVDRYRIPKGLLELELTESAFIENANALLKTFNRLKELKFIISLDDFGTGFSALKLLTELPVDVLKLDKDFLKKGQTTKREQIVLEHVVSMSKNLDIKVVSEGVETTAQADFLAKIGCNLAQGYLFARPMPLEEFEKRLQALTVKSSAR